MKKILFILIALFEVQVQAQTLEGHGSIGSANSGISRPVQQSSENKGNLVQRSQNSKAEQYGSCVVNVLTNCSRHWKFHQPVNSDDIKQIKYISHIIASGAVGYDFSDAPKWMGSEKQFDPFAHVSNWFHATAEDKQAARAKRFLIQYVISREYNSTDFGLPPSDLVAKSIIQNCDRQVLGE